MAVAAVETAERLAITRKGLTEEIDARRAEACQGIGDEQLSRALAGIDPAAQRARNLEPIGVRDRGAQRGISPIAVDIGPATEATGIEPGLWRQFETPIAAKVERLGRAHEDAIDVDRPEACL